jgi:antitoxin component of MazEF toxin-antitoxin module
MPASVERKEARLRKTGGSRSVTIPRSWLRSMDITDRVELTFTGKNITIEPPAKTQALEDRPEFADFLDFLTKDALLHPEHLVNAAQFMADDDALFAGVVLDSLYDETDGH